MSLKYISQNNPEITFKPEIFLNHEEKQRSGHLGHAMVRCADGSILAFYSNCSGTHGWTQTAGGHTMQGWVEYRRSTDNGKTWGEPFESYVDKIARNPQVAFLNGYYICHARSENGVNFVVYYSKDGINWSSGTIVSDPLDGRPRGGCYYSNNLNIVGDDGKERLLVQYSEQYAHQTARVNVMHAWIECCE